MLVVRIKKQGRIPITQEFKRLKDAKAELYKISELVGYEIDKPIWITKDRYEVDIFKR